MVRITTGFFLLIGFAASVATNAQENKHHLTNIGMFFVGGSVKDGATNHSGQALIHFFKSDAPAEVPVVLYPGLGLSSYVFISTPDGREGWAQTFARAGHAAYVYDPVNTGLSGLPTDEPSRLTTWNVDEVWPRFGFGDRRDQPYDNTRFPTENIDQFYASWPVRIAAKGNNGRTVDARRPTDRPPARVLAGSAIDEAALVELLEKIGPAVLIPHSMGGATVFRLAKSRPELVRGIVVVEPVGCPQKAEEVEPWIDSPFLAVYGDFIESRNQSGRREACRNTARLANEAGGSGTMLDLPEENVFGNTHILMQDDNSEDIAAQIIHWINERIK